MRGKKVKVKCLCCGVEFMARVADRKRGWGKHCSKSCKATKQERRTGQYKTYSQSRREYDGTFIPSMESGFMGHGQE